MKTTVSGQQYTQSIKYEQRRKLGLPINMTNPQKQITCSSVLDEGHTVTTVTLTLTSGRTHSSVNHKLKMDVRLGAHSSEFTNECHNVYILLLRNYQFAIEGNYVKAFVFVGNRVIAE